MNDRRGGFTLTELLVVMAAGSTLAILAIGGIVLGISVATIGSLARLVLSLV